MKIVIAGAGEVGSHLAKMLSNEDQDIILIDPDQEKLNLIDNNYNLMTYCGSTYSFRSLKDVSVSKADLFVAVTPYETQNITACTIAKQLGAKCTVARIDNFEFLEKNNSKILQNIGVDRLIYPEHLAAQELITALEHNWARHWAEIAHGKMLLIGVKLRGNSPLVNHLLRDLPIQTHTFHIAAIKRNHETIIPNGDDELLEGDIVFFVTFESDADTIRELCGKTEFQIKRVMIMGGTRIAMRFALESKGEFDIKIIEPDRAICERLATRLPDCDVEQGDARDIDTLRENNIDQYDAFVALSDSSETNILSCLTAKEFGIKKTVADVENLQFVGQAENLNIGTILNKKLIASSRIFKLLLDADEHNAKTFALADAEVAELKVKEKSKITKSEVKNLRLPYGMTLAAVTHDGHCSLVTGQTHIHPGDIVVVFCLTGSLHKIEHWFN
ncbi:MAG: Trk system potassium transporter TrkA [Prevotella sp.]|nr:Trk system potassium transporter TrkA [Prevotella sp.]MCM1075117.1 Trk system potassium transporter TrkA [Ruminococcus sp.]